MTDQALIAQLLGALKRLKIEIVLSDIDMDYIESHFRPHLEAAEAAIAAAEGRMPNVYSIAAAEAAQHVAAPDLATQLRALAQQHGWNFVWAMARQIEDGTKTCHKCHNGGLTHSSRCVHYDKAEEQAEVAEYRAHQTATPPNQPVAASDEVQRAVEAEREACARLCETAEIPINIDVWMRTKKELSEATAIGLAAAIRARGNNNIQSGADSSASQ
ncbi:hypothetical protein [Paludibacterium denitrificans]|uniref:Uncharacterized protein n=1 Tax=Paludibacterium denitrificans TaxID=2675226 RepID=A0A844GAE8_9NEIS|nr:hypothetical protein [Paludibacterium denitrificans]MTD32599.1 hypothetical protein [Paludibacterium denitrificans]